MCVDEFPAILDIVDTAGQEEFTSLQDQYMTHADGYYVVYSLVERTTFTEVDRLRTRITRLKDDECIPFLLVGNKAGEQ